MQLMSCATPTLYRIPHQACAFWQTMMAEVRAHAEEREEFETRLRRIEADCGVKQNTLDGAGVRVLVVL